MVRAVELHALLVVDVHPEFGVRSYGCCRCPACCDGVGGNLHEERVVVVGTLHVHVACNAIEVAVDIGGNGIEQIADLSDAVGLARSGVYAVQIGIAVGWRLGILIELYAIDFSRHRVVSHVVDEQTGGYIHRSYRTEGAGERVDGADGIRYKGSRTVIGAGIAVERVAGEGCCRDDLRHTEFLAVVVEHGVGIGVVGGEIDNGVSAVAVVELQESPHLRLSVGLVEEHGGC